MRKRNLSNQPVPGFCAIHPVASLADRSAVGPQGLLGPSAHPKHSCGDREHPLKTRSCFTVLDPIGQRAQHQRLNLRDGVRLRRAISHRARKRRHFRNPPAIIFSFDFNLHGTTMALEPDPASDSSANDQAEPRALSWRRLSSNDDAGLSRLALLEIAGPGGALRSGGRLSPVSLHIFSIFHLRSFDQKTSPVITPPRTTQ